MIRLSFNRELCQVLNKFSLVARKSFITSSPLKQPCRALFARTSSSHRSPSMTSHSVGDVKKYQRLLTKSKRFYSTSHERFEGTISELLPSTDGMMGFVKYIDPTKPGREGHEHGISRVSVHYRNFAGADPKVKQVVPDPGTPIKFGIITLANNRLSCANVTDLKDRPIPLKTLASIKKYTKTNNIDLDEVFHGKVARTVSPTTGYANFETRDGIQRRAVLHGSNFLGVEEDKVYKIPVVGTKLRFKVSLVKGKDLQAEEVSDNLGNALELKPLCPWKYLPKPHGEYTYAYVSDWLHNSRGSIGWCKWPNPENGSICKAAVSTDQFVGHFKKGSEKHSIPSVGTIIRFVLNKNAYGDQATLITDKTGNKITLKPQSENPLPYPGFIWRGTN
eukprot:Awhi_evm1s2684